MFCIEYFIVIFSDIGKGFLFPCSETCMTVNRITHIHCCFVGAYSAGAAHLYHLECSLKEEIACKYLTQRRNTKYMQAYTNLILHGNSHKFQEIMFRQ